MGVESRMGQPPLLLTRIASFVAIGLVAGLALSSIPNVELVTAVCFTSGYLLGPSAGLLTGGLTEAIFAGFHPMGSSIGLLLVAQILGMAAAGLIGAFARFLTRDNTRRSLHSTIIVVSGGVVATLIFDLLTNLAFPIMAGFSFAQFLVSMAAAVPFAVIHLVSNTLVFLIIVVPLLPRLEKAMRLS